MSHDEARHEAKQRPGRLKKRYCYNAGTDFQLTPKRTSRMNALKKFEPYAYAALRIVFGFLFACHGASKIFGVLGGEKPHGVLMWTGAGIELVGGVLIIIGLLTQLAAFLSSGEMAVAYFMYHQPRGFFPMVNHGELAVIYCFVALYIACRGAGKWGVDKS
jgi:putative oxidoreductase